MHDDLWAGVESALHKAQFHFLEASRSLQRPERTAWSTRPKIISGNHCCGQTLEALCPHIDSFLVSSRSVPDVIESCFGHDNGWPKEMKAWFDALSADEKTRRDEFSKQFNADRDQFRKHYLTKAANIAVHRRGFAPVEGVVIGPTGKPYPASPIMSVPIAESPSVGDDAPLWARTQPPIPVRPSGDEDKFKIDGKPLFPELQAYLQLAHQLRDKARDICQRVHDGKHLTPPPW